MYRQETHTIKVNKETNLVVEGTYTEGVPSTWSEPEFSESFEGDKVFIEKSGHLIEITEAVEMFGFDFESLNDYILTKFY